MDLDFGALAPPVGQMFVEICRFGCGGLVFPGADFTPFLGYQFYYFYDIIYLCNCEKFALTFSTPKINEI